MVVQKLSDELLVVRSVLKICSAFDNWDDLVACSSIDFEAVPKKLRFELQGFFKWFSENLSEYCWEMCCADLESYYELVYGWGSWFDECVLAETETKKYLSLLLAKVFSAVKDLLQIVESDFGTVLINRIKSSFSTKYIASNFNLKSFNRVVKGIDAMYNEIIGE